MTNVVTERCHRVFACIVQRTQEKPNNFELPRVQKPYRNYYHASRRGIDSTGENARRHVHVTAAYRCPSDPAVDIPLLLATSSCLSNSPICVYTLTGRDTGASAIMATWVVWSTTHVDGATAPCPPYRRRTRLMPRSPSFRPSLNSNKNCGMRSASNSDASGNICRLPRVDRPIRRSTMSAWTRRGEAVRPHGAVSIISQWRCGCCTGTSSTRQFRDTSEVKRGQFWTFRVRRTRGQWVSK